MANLGGLEKTANQITALEIELGAEERIGIILAPGNGK